MVMIRVGFLIFWSFVILFIFCECSQHVTNKFDTFNDELSQCDWYLFTNAMQRMLLIVLVNAQQSIFIHGYGDIQCTRDTFKNVCE